MSNCDKCGTPVRGRSLCDVCELSERKGDTAGADAGSDPDPVTVRCTVDGCGTVYKHPTRDACPECGSTRRRSAPDAEPDRRVEA